LERYVAKKKISFASRMFVFIYIIGKEDFSDAFFVTLEHSRTICSAACLCTEMDRERGFVSALVSVISLAHPTRTLDVSNTEITPNEPYN
jgi:hypothetical protein